MIKSEDKQAETKARMIKQIMEALYPVLYPVEQQDCAVQARHQEKLKAIAEEVWKQFK